MNIFSRTETATEAKIQIMEHVEVGAIQIVPKPKIRSIKITITPFRGVQVIIPSRLSKREAERFISKKQVWISKTLVKARETEIQSREFFRSIGAVSPTLIRKTLSSRLDDLSGQHGFAYGKLSIRNQKSRWGSCSSKNNISLNRKLYFLPSELSDYVLLHELAHTVQKNHSKAFWNILYDILGETETIQARAALRSFEFLFYPPPTNATTGLTSTT